MIIFVVKLLLELLEYHQQQAQPVHINLVVVSYQDQMSEEQIVSNIITYQHVDEQDRHDNDKHYPQHNRDRRKGDRFGIITPSSCIKPEERV